MVMVIVVLQLCLLVLKIERICEGKYCLKCRFDFLPSIQKSQCCVNLFYSQVAESSCELCLGEKLRQCSNN